MAMIPIGASTDRGSIVPSGVAFDRWMVVVIAWLIGGLFLDGWAHRHIEDLESFFTPWHAVLYSGFVATAGSIGWILFRNHQQGQPWRRALPAGYVPSFLGVLIFLGGGLGDMIWHLLFGVEADLEALISPTHLVLAVGGGLLAVGPLYATWLKPRDVVSRGFFASVPMLLSLSFTWSICTFMTQFAHPLIHLWPAGDPPSGVFFRQSLEISGILLQTALMMGFILPVVIRWLLPFGSLTLVFSLNAFLMAGLVGHYYMILAAFTAGVVSDVLQRGLKPFNRRPFPIRLFSAGVPFVTYASYFLTLALFDGIWWSIHLWTGAIFLAGISGWLLSYLILPPEMPQT